MKYEVIKEYPGCGQIKKGYIIDIKYEIDPRDPGYCGRYGCFIIDEKTKLLPTVIDFNPADYPEFFKPIEDKPKWIDKKMIVAEISSGAAPRCATIEIHKNGLYTREDMVEFAKYFDSGSINDEYRFFYEWVEAKKRQS